MSAAEALVWIVVILLLAAAIWRLARRR